MSGEVKIILGTPIQAYGEEVSVLTLREPTGRDVRDCGYPFRIHADGEEVTPLAVALARYISVLAKIPMGSVDRLTAADFIACTNVVMGFFGESPGDSPGKGREASPAVPDAPSKTSPATSPPCSADRPAPS